MDVATFHPVFLLLALSQAASAYVEPPTNVRLHCHNMHNVLEWHYGQFSPGLRFRVDIGSKADLNGYPNELWVNPAEKLQADVSFLSDPSNDYLITVTAVVGQNESDSAPHDGINFSYFKDSPADQKCGVDFPSVNVTAQHDGTVLLRFAHPWVLYHHKMPSTPSTKVRKRKSHNAQIPVFHYQVVVVHPNERHHSLLCVDSVCEERLSVDAAQKKHCLKMMGQLEKISVKATQEYCVLSFEEKPSYLIHICVVSSLLALSSVAFIVFMVYRKKTMPSTSTPASMIFKGKPKQWTWGAVEDTVFVQEAGPASPTPLLSAEETVLTPTVPSTELRLPIGVSTDNVDVSDDVEEAIDGGPEYMPGRTLDDDRELDTNEESSGYEKRQVVVEFAPDDLAEGYRG